MYERNTDPEGYEYYVNKQTGESSWEKPRLLGTEGLHKKHYEMSESEAATRLQGMYRARKSRRAMRRMIRAVYVKEMDESG